jgi:hypothetical protein
MISDNGMQFIMKIKPQCKATFVTIIFDGKKNYIAANRAARRLLRSGRIKNLGLSIDLELNAIW